MPNSTDNLRNWFEGLSAFTRHVTTVFTVTVGIVGGWTVLGLPVPATKFYVDTAIARVQNETSEQFVLLREESKRQQILILDLNITSLRQRLTDARQELEEIVANLETVQDPAARDILEGRQQSLADDIDTTIESIRTRQEAINALRGNAQGLFR